MTNKPKTSLKKWIRTVSNFVDFIPFQLICQILATLFQLLNLKGQDLGLQKGKENFCCVHLLYKVGAWNYEVSCRRRATTARKCTKKREARAKLLFCQFKPIAFCRSRCCRHRQCLSSLLSKHFATMVTWRDTSPLLSSSIWVLIEVLELNFYVYRFP